MAKPGDWGSWLKQTGIGEYNPEVESYARPKGLSYEDAAWQIYNRDPSRWTGVETMPTAGTGQTAPSPTSITDWGGWLRGKGFGEGNPEVERIAREHGLSYEDAAFRHYYGLPMTSDISTPSGTRSALGSADLSTGGLLGKQEGREADFLTKLSSTLEGFEPISAMAERLGTELGLPGQRELTTGLTQAALDLEQTLASLPENIKSETRGFDVNQAQLERIMAKRAAPLQTRLSETARSAERAGVAQRAMEQQLGTRLGYGLQEQERGLLPLQQEAEFISDRAAREMTMYSTERQAELSTLLQKMQGQQALDQIDARKLVNLALQEDEYQKQKDFYKFQADRDLEDYFAKKDYGATGIAGTGNIQGDISDILGSFGDNTVTLGMGPQTTGGITTPDASINIPTSDYLRSFEEYAQ